MNHGCIHSIGGYVKCPRNNLIYKIDKFVDWTESSRYNCYMAYVTTNRVAFNDDYIKIDEINKWEAIANPYWPQDKIDESLYEIYKQTKPLLEQKNALQEQIKKLNDQKKIIQNYCDHKFDKGEEEEGRRTWMGLEIKKTCECELCGLTAFAYYTKIG